MKSVMAPGLVVLPVEEYQFPSWLMGVVAGGGLLSGVWRHDLRSYQTRLDPSGLLSAGIRLSDAPPILNGLIAARVVTLGFAQAPEIKPSSIACVEYRPGLLAIPVGVSAQLKGWDLRTLAVDLPVWAGVGIECGRAAQVDVRPLEVSRKAGWAGSWRRAPWTAAGVVSGIYINVKTEIA